MASIVTVQEVRDISGAPSTLIDNDIVRSIVSLVEDKTKSLFGIELTPVKKIETTQGDWKKRIQVDEYFPLKVLEIRNGNTVMDIDENIYVDTYEGFIEITGDTIAGEYLNRFSGWDLNVKVKYLYGAIEKNNKFQTESTTVISPGTSVAVIVDDASGFSVNDYVYLEDMNGKYEVSKVTVVDNTTQTITFDIINNTYEVDTLVINSKVIDIFRQFILYESALAVAANSIGSTYTIATGYSIEGVQVQVGVPYTHWRENFEKNIKMRDSTLLRIKNLLGSIV